MRYLVAVDGGAVSDAAFKTVCATMRKEDDLILVHIVPDMAKKYAVTALEHAPAVSLVSNEAQESINERGKKVLDAYIRRAKDAGLTHIKGVLGVSTHEGEFICRLAANRDVDFIYLGRRGLNNFSRFFMGSTSKYVMENAEANVCIVKAPADKEGDATPAAGKERAYHGEAIDVKHP